MRVLFMGTPDFAVGTLCRILEKGHEVVGVVTQPDKPAGRGKQMRFSPVKEEALKHNIPVFQPQKVRDTEVVRELSELKPDIAVVVAFGQILPKTLLDMPRLGCLNVHASILPAYRGAAPIQWAILRGEEKTGVTIMQMDEGLDTGDILAIRETPVSADETGGSLHDRLALMGADLLVEVLDLAEAGKLDPVKQGETTTPYASMLTKEMGRIRWDNPAAVIERQIRGLSPWPSAYAYLNGKTFKIWKARIVELPETEELRTAKSGDIVVRTDKELVVKTGDGCISLLEVQLEGKKRMKIDDFLRGIRETELS